MKRKYSRNKNGELTAANTVFSLPGIWAMMGAVGGFALAVWLFFEAKDGRRDVFDMVPDVVFGMVVFGAVFPFIAMAWLPKTHTGLALMPFATVPAMAFIGSLNGHIYRISGGFWSFPWLMLLGAIFASYLWFKAIFGGAGSEAEQRATYYGPSSTQGDSQNEASAPVRTFDWTKPRFGLSGLAGMAELKQELGTAIMPFKDYARQGRVADRNGFMLSGPPGNGKTAFAEAIAGELGLPFLKVGVQDLTSKWVNESPEIIKALFKQAATRPCVVFLDEFDAIGASRGSGSGSAEDKKVVNTLLSEIDEARKHHIVLLAATNFPDQIDPAIARDGRFDFRIEIPYPDVVAREAVLGGMLTKFGVKATADTIRHVAELWERRSVSFIEAVAKRLRDDGKGRAGPATVQDFKAAARAASRRPSAIPSTGDKVSELVLPREVRTEVESLIYRLRNWESIAERGGEPPTGILLYGPPGTGKTNLVRAWARELGDWHVFEVSVPDVLQNPRKFRDTVELAANHRPAFVFIDEADELLKDRNYSNAASATNEILKVMDGMMGRVPEVVFVAATNNMEVMDAAALRGGRFAEKIFLPRLSGEDLVVFLERQLAMRKNLRLARGVSADTLAREFGEIAPADALALIRKAVNYTFTDSGDSGNRPLDMDDFRRARLALGQ